MKPEIDQSTTPDQKMQRFETALGKVLSVSKDELNSKLVQDEKERRLRKNKPGPSPKS